MGAYLYKNKVGGMFYNGQKMHALRNGAEVLGSLVSIKFHFFNSNGVNVNDEYGYPMATMTFPTGTIVNEMNVCSAVGVSYNLSVSYQSVGKAKFIATKDLDGQTKGVCVY